MKKLILLGTFIAINTCFYAQIDETYQSYLEETLALIESVNEPVGLSVAVVQGEEEWSSAIGISSETEPLTTESLLAMGSITKTFVSACILSLMEDNKLTLNDPISQYISTYENIDSSITIRQLLNHSSGIYNYTENPIFFDDVLDPFNQFREYPAEEVLERFILEPVFAKGTRQEYSNTNYVILGLIISEITERPYYEEIFERFEIEKNYPSISIAPYLIETNDLADLWADLGSGLENIESLGLGLDGLFSSAGAAGAFVGTPTDVAKWGRDLYSGKLLEQASLDSMMVFFGGEDSGYGLGVVSGILPCGSSVVGHSGGIIYTSNLFYVPEHNLSIVAMTNDGSGIPDIDGVGGLTVEMVCNYKFLVDTEESSLEEFNLITYPNPVEDKLQIELTGSNQKLTAQIFSYDGSMIYESKMASNKMSIDLREKLNPGMFYLRLSDNERVVTRKLIKI